VFFALVPIGYTFTHTLTQLNNYDSAGLEIVGDSLQRRLVERDGMLELLVQQQVNDKDCERDTDTKKEVCKGMGSCPIVFCVIAWCTRYGPAFNAACYCTIIGKSQPAKNRNPSRLISNLSRPKKKAPSTCLPRNLPCLVLSPAMRF
jgi:hypothetical protein